MDSSETRSNLLVGARRIFARDGFAATTNRSIAEEVGITTGAIYHYYPSKADLFAAVYAQVRDLVDARFEAAIAEPGTLTQRFSRVLDAAVELNQNDSSLVCFVVSVPTEVMRHSELVEALAPEWSRSNRFIATLVAEAQANGEFVDGVDVAAVNDLLGSVLSGLAVFSTITGDIDRYRGAVRALHRFLGGDLVHRVR